MNLEGAQFNVGFVVNAITFGILNAFHCSNYSVSTCFGKDVINGAALPHVFRKTIGAGRKYNFETGDSAGVIYTVNGKRYIGEVFLPVTVVTLNELIAYVDVGCGEIKRISGFNRNVNAAGEDVITEETRKSLNLEGAQFNVGFVFNAVAVGILNAFHCSNYSVSTCFGKNVINGSAHIQILIEFVFAGRSFNVKIGDSSGVSNAVNGKRYVREVFLPVTVVTLNELIAYIELGCGEIKRISGFNRNIDVALPIVKTGRSNFFLCRYAHRYNGEHCNDHKH